MVALEAPSSTSCAESRNRRFPSEIGALSRFHRFYREEEGPEICCLANWRATAVQQEEAWAIWPLECLGFACGVWHEKFDKSFLNREGLFYVEGAQMVRADGLKGESHLGLRRLVPKNTF
jgi:hypothetical protein